MSERPAYDFNQLWWEDWCLRELRKNHTHESIAEHMNDRYQPRSSNRYDAYTVTKWAGRAELREAWRPTLPPAPVLSLKR